MCPRGKLKKKSIRLLLFFGITALFLYSCDTSVNSNIGNSLVYEGPGGGRENGRFYAQNMVNNRFYSLYADKLWNKQDSKCVVWAERGSGITEQDAKKVAEYYDDIYVKMMAVFGLYKNFTDVFANDGKVIASDIMELADYYGNGDKKLCILLLKIEDSYTPGVNNSYVAGYFSPYNFLGYDPKDTYTYYSNECDMIYIDVKYITLGLPEPYSTLAHEMQHLMNYVTSISERFNGRTPRQMDLWIDEGLSGAAEYVTAGEHNKSRVEWYNEDPTRWITNGNNFYIWGNYTSSNPLAVLDDYATVYIFFQWLRLQSKDPQLKETNIYREIIYSPHSNYEAVTAAAVNAISNDYKNNWPLLLRDWLAANYINASAGRYGYKNDPVLNQIKPLFLKGASGSSYPLAPGEGIYTQKTSMPETAPYIKYSGLPSRGSLSYPNDHSVSGYSALLSYNADTSANANNYSFCSPFSVETDPSLRQDTRMNTASFRLSQEQPSLSGPYPISAGDMLRLNGHEEDQR